MAAQERREYKICIIGDFGVGKTSLLQRFASGVFDKGQSATLGVDHIRKQSTLEGPSGLETVDLCIWDTAGQERFRTLASSFYRGAHGVMVVVDHTDRESFQNTKSWLHEIDRYCTTSSVAKMLVCSKSDLTKGSHGSPLIPEEEMSKFAEANSMTLRRTSAKNGAGVDEAFQFMAGSIHEAFRRELLAQNRVNLQEQRESAGGGSLCF